MRPRGGKLAALQRREGEHQVGALLYRRAALGAAACHQRLSGQGHGVVKSWRVVPGGTPQFGQGTAKVFKYTVELENGMDPTAFGGDDAFAAMVDQTLANPIAGPTTPSSRSSGSTPTAESSPTSASR